MSRPSSPTLSQQENVHGHADIQIDPYAAAASPSSSEGGKLSRTVAIIKNHALEHRFDIEHRIQEAKFEIVKERQMEFDVDSDPDFLYELFGEDAASLAEGPVWVYVLERRKAVETWEALMGPSDPKQGSNSLRALYGISAEQNGLMGATDVETAELQIASLFASSPPFPTSDLPDSRFNTLKSVSSSVMAELQQMVIADSEDGGVFSPGSSVTSPTSTSTGTGKQGSATRKSGNFKARALPATHAKPDIAPRMSRAAMLRAGVAVPEKDESKRPRGVPLSKEQMAKTFANVPGHKRATSIAVASTAAPKIAPRMTRAASLRANGGVEPAPVKRRPSLDMKSSFEGVPGHKRRETIAVASVAAPTVAPRLNRSAQLRAQKESAPPSSFMFRAPSAPKVPGLSRSNSQASNYEPVSRPSSAASHTSAKPISRSTSASNIRSTSSTNVRSTSTSAPRTSISTSTSTSTPAAPPKTRRPSLPSIAPRSNRAAELRATKKALEEEAAALAAARAKRASAKPISRRASMQAV